MKRITAFFDLYWYLEWHQWENAAFSATHSLKIGFRVKVEANGGIGVRGRIRAVGPGPLAAAHQRGGGDLAVLVLWGPRLDRQPPLPLRGVRGRAAGIINAGGGVRGGRAGQSAKQKRTHARAQACTYTRTHLSAPSLLEPGCALRGAEEECQRAAGLGADVQDQSLSTLSEGVQNNI